jgi:predicted  nucleic acid-binding Zn-ribbon protein
MQESNQVSLLLEMHALQSDANGVEKAEACQRIERSLDRSLLNRYLNLKKRKGTAVAVLRDCVCSECMIMYPVTHEIFRYKDSIHS